MISNKLNKFKLIIPFLFILASLYYGRESENISLIFYAIMFLLSLCTIIYRYLNDRNILNMLDTITNKIDKYDNKIIYH